MAGTLLVHEIYVSVQGESTFAGLPCIFIRLTGCNLRCSYCDTAYAFQGGERLSAQAILAQIDKLAAPFADSRVSGATRLPLVELTGGEPLLQKESLALMRKICDSGFTVLLETSGALDISVVDPRVRRIMDVKCPSSGEAGRNLWGNLRVLRATDEVKFVIGTREDYEFAKALIWKHNLHSLCPLLFSWVHPLAAEQRDPSLSAIPEGQTPISRQELVERIIADALPVRFQAQLHKIIWPPEARGV